MTAERWKRMEDLFQAAVARPEAERAAFLEAACPGDASLRAEVEALLASDDEAESAFREIAAGVAAQWVAGRERDELIGQTLGHYKILAPLGAGGMGEVYLAEDTTLDRKAALKLLPRKFTQDADRLRRFEQEARTASALNHPGIITIHEVGQWRGTHFIATEFIEGETLRDRFQKPRLPVAEVLDIGCQAAGALAAAHAAGIVHRDIKPANIMLRADGYIKVLDFGLAKLTASTSDLELTEPGRVMGTISYMSPEQALGKPVDHRTDIFSLGVVLYEIATGHRLFDGPSEAATYDRILHEAPPPMRNFDPALPAELDEVIRRALEKDPDRRYATAIDLRNDLRRLAQGSGETDAARISASEQRAVRRSRVLRIAAAVAALALILCTTFFFGSRSMVQKDRAPAAAKQISQKSVAVLPFENLTRDQENAAFTDGVQDQVLTDLSKVSELKVISRTSVMRYRAGAPRNLREIGQQLGVAYVLEGSVQRAGHKVRVNAQLIDAATDEHLWAETYDRDLADVFAIQSEIAKAIASQLRAQLSPAQKVEIEREPTSDLAAFDLFTRGKALVDEARGYDNAEANFTAGVELLDEATRRDPNFFGAYIHLARAHAAIALAGIDNTPVRLDKAKKALAAAQRISPQSGDPSGHCLDALCGT